MQKTNPLSEMREWMGKCLPCVAGRREFLINRYMMRLVETPEDVRRVYDEFLIELEGLRTVSCLFILGTDAVDYRTKSVSYQMRQMAHIMAILSDKSPDALVSGASLNCRITTVCPVTNHQVTFDDFDIVAFAPASENEQDPLYDPMMAAPVICANLNSDVYAFSMFVKDMSLKKLNRAPWELQYDDRQSLFNQASYMWQQFATRTIKNYISITNTKKCPTFLSSDNHYWYASHKDPAFSENRKDLYRHNMPVLYTQTIIERWKHFFNSGEMPELWQATPPGRRV